MKKLYQWEHYEDITPENISKWETSFGPRVIDRKEGHAHTVQLSVLVDNPKTKVILAGPFNNWGKDTRTFEEYTFIHDENDIFATLTTNKLKHKDPYKLLVNQGKGWFYIQDPAAPYFDNDSNSVFWDFKDQSAYKKKHSFINTHERSTRIIQTDLPGLIMHWADKDGICGRDIHEQDYYAFITRSGIIKHLKELGFNTIQFLPFAQSIDGDNWKFRYLIPFQFAIQKNWGTPDEFAEMVDTFHKHGIAVIGDFVISHLPFKDFSVFGHSCKHNGLHQWKNRHNTRLFMKEETPWGTMRIDYDNQYVRQFFQESCLHFMKNYHIDGFRIDNVDGILRFGHNGDGEERPHGRTMLRELNQTIYKYNPHAMINLESHYFYHDNAKMLVIPFDQDQRSLGATAYNSSRLTYFLHKEYMPKDIEQVSLWRFRHITEEKEWGQSNSTIADFHNHDAAAGLMEMRCTGSYAYDAMTYNQPENHMHALGKIKVMEAIISFMCEGRTLDLAQTFLLQKGTFEHDSSIHWPLTFNQASRNLLAYKRRINEVMDADAFWPINTKHRQFLNVDDKNKILVIERKGTSRFVIVINLSSWTHFNYKVGVKTKKDYKVVLNSDLFDYSGQGLISYPEVLKNKPSKNFEFLDREVVLTTFAPYGVVVLEEKK
ncbi:MAG: alpha-amylase family glycosyl hydrolase [Nanobdellota archaeon]